MNHTLEDTYTSSLRLSHISDGFANSCPCILALAVGNIDFERLTVKIQRSFVQGEVRSRKTEPSESFLPLDPTWPICISSTAPFSRPCHRMFDYLEEYSRKFDRIIVLPASFNVSCERV